MKPFFTAEELEKQFTVPNGMQALADYCNAKLEREGKRVFLCNGELKTIHYVEPVDTTHTALLIGIQEIEK